mmetsp:Transcript_7071/g.12684  ORF Transcript_7071/g.12684 Transcript_7071/m.12684 type:complete len:506 (+) Transcript_7071:89-1606(+)
MNIMMNSCAFTLAHYQNTIRKHNQLWTSQRHYFHSPKSASCHRHHHHFHILQTIIYSQSSNNTNNHNLTQEDDIFRILDYLSASDDEDSEDNDSILDSNRNEKSTNGNENSDDKLIPDTDYEMEDEKNDVDFFYDPTLGSFEIRSEDGSLVTRGELEDALDFSLSGSWIPLLPEPQDNRTQDDIQNAWFDYESSASNSGNIKTRNNSLREYEIDNTVREDGQESDDDDDGNEYDYVVYSGNNSSESAAYELSEEEDAYLYDSDEESGLYGALSGSVGENSLLFEEDDAEKFVGEMWANSFGDEGYIQSSTSGSETDEEESAHQIHDEDLDEVERGNGRKRFVVLDVLDVGSDSEEIGSEEEEDILNAEEDLDVRGVSEIVSVEEFVEEDGALLVEMSKECNSRIQSMNKYVTRITAQLKRIEKRLHLLYSSSSKPDKVKEPLQNRFESDSNHEIVKEFINTKKQIQLLKAERKLLHSERIRYSKLIAQDQSSLDQFKSLFAQLHN